MSLHDESIAITENSRLETKASLNETFSVEVNFIIEEYEKIDQTFTEISAEYFKYY